MTILTYDEGCHLNIEGTSDYTTKSNIELISVIDYRLLFTINRIASEYFHLYFDIYLWFFYNHYSTNIYKIFLQINL